MKHLYFVRHGESRANATGIREGSGSPLTEKGKAQAEVVARRMKSLAIERIVASDYMRAQETATISAKHLGFASFDTSPLFGERKNPSVMLGKHTTDKEMERMWDTIAANYGTIGWRHSDEENFEDLVLRAKSGLLYLESLPEERIMVACHGLYMKVVVAYIQLGSHLNGRIFWDGFVPMATVKNTAIMYAQFTENYFQKKMYWKLVTWNDHAHLSDMPQAIAT